MVEKDGREPDENKEGQVLSPDGIPPVVPVEITPVTLENVDQTVDQVVGWLREDFARNPKQFFGENPVDTKKKPVSYDELARAKKARVFRYLKC